MRENRYIITPVCVVVYSDYSEYEKSGYRHTASACKSERVLARYG